MFRDIDKINWTLLQQAHGDARHVPQAIKGLISFDSDEQESSYWKLDNYIVLQGDLYQAAFFVIPFLTEILSSDIQNGRGYVYDLLFEINNGYGPDDVLCIYKGKEYPLGEACKKSIADNYNLFVSEVANQSSEHRDNALDLLITLEYKQDDVVRELSLIRSNEIDPTFCKKLDEAIAEIKSNMGTMD